MEGRQMIRFSQGFKRYFANTSWLMSERIFSLLVGLCVGIYVARYLGPQRFGLLNYAISFVGLFAAIAEMGLTEITVREFIDANTPKSCLFGTVFLLRTIGAFVVIFLAMTGIWLLGDDYYTRGLVALVAISFIFQAFRVIELYFQSQVLAKYAVVAQLAQMFVSAGAKVFLIQIKAELVWFAFVIVLENVVMALTLSLLFRRFGTVPLSEWRFNSFLAKKLLKESFPLALSGLVVAVYMKIDQVMIKNMMTAEAVGLYAVAVRLSEAWYFIPSVVMKSLFPAVVAVRQKENRRYHLRLQQLHDFLSMLALLVAVPVSIWAGDIVSVVFGERFASAGTVLAIHIWAGMVVFPGNVRAHLIVLEKRQMVALIFRSLGVAVNVGLNLLLIPRFGIIGAAWATIASYVIPVCTVALFDDVIRMTVIMTVKSYLLPLRALLYGKALYADTAV